MSDARHRLAETVGELLKALAGSSVEDALARSLDVRVAFHHARCSGVGLSLSIWTGAAIASDAFVSRAQSKFDDRDRELWSELLTKVEAVLEHHLALLLAPEEALK